MVEMAINCQNHQILNKNLMTRQRGPFESGDFGVNGMFGEYGGNGD